VNAIKTDSCRAGLTRRELVVGTAAAGLLATGLVPAAASDEGTVPNSSGTAHPRHKAPAGAADCHIHVLDPRFPTAKSGQTLAPGMTAADYRLLQKRNGTSRVVIVQPKPFGTDNRCIIDAVSQFGGNARGIAVIKPDVAEADLKAMNDKGIRGVRFSVWNAADAVVGIDMIEPVARRIAPYGWHVQLHMSGDQAVENAAMLKRLPCPMVFDHMGRLPPEVGPAHPAFKLIVSLVEQDKAWVKLAGAYLNTRIGPPEYADATRIARAFVAAVPDRLVWGSDWPHTTEKKHKPDDALLFDLLAVWAGDEKTRKRILVDNPKKLYGFV